MFQYLAIELIPESKLDINVVAPNQQTSDKKHFFRVLAQLRQTARDFVCSHSQVIALPKFLNRKLLHF